MSTRKSLLPQLRKVRVLYIEIYVFTSSVVDLSAIKMFIKCYIYDLQFANEIFGFESFHVFNAC